MYFSSIMLGGNTVQDWKTITQFSTLHWRPHYLSRQFIQKFAAPPTFATARRDSHKSHQLQSLPRWARIPLRPRRCPGLKYSVVSCVCLFTSLISNMSSRFLNHSLTSTISVPGRRQTVSQPYITVFEVARFIWWALSGCASTLCSWYSCSRQHVVTGIGPVHSGILQMNPSLHLSRWITP